MVELSFNVRSTALRVTRFSLLNTHSSLFLGYPFIKREIDLKYGSAFIACLFFNVRVSFCVFFYYYGSGKEANGCTEMSYCTVTKM